MNEIWSCKIIDTRSQSEIRTTLYDDKDRPHTVDGSVNAWLIEWKALCYDLAAQMSVEKFLCNNDTFYL